MKPLAAALALSLGAAAADAQTPEVPISTAAARTTNAGPAEWFTGAVRVEPLFAAHPPARGSGGSVTFQPGARTAWHTHPLGQTLVVTAGRGHVQFWGGPRRDIGPGDVVWIPAGQKHWHGAAADAAMTHLALQEALDGQVVDWLEQVSDAQYGAR